MKTGGFENIELGKVAPSEGTDFLGTLVTRQIHGCHMQLLKWGGGACHIRTMLPFLPRKETLVTLASRVLVNTEEAGIQPASPPPALPAHFLCSSGLSLAGVFVFSLIACKRSILLLKAELPSGIGRVCPSLPPWPPLQVLCRTTRTS